jgi:Domain of unknown function (DUF4189)
MRRLYILLASVVIATLLCAVASGASAAPGTGGGPNKPRLSYGALVVSPSPGPRTFWHSTTTSQDSAVRFATSKCRSAATYCRAGVWVKNGYAAFALDANGAWGTGWGASEARAVLEAKISCQFWGGVACDYRVEPYKTITYYSSLPTSGGIPYIPPPVTNALPPAATGSGVGGTGQDR